MVDPIQWIEQDGSPERDNAEGVTVSSSQGRLYATGNTFGSITEQTKVPGSGFNVWLRLFDLNGNTLDTEQLNSESEDSVPNDFAHSIAVDSGRGPNGTVYVVGETFGDITNDSERLINQGASDAFIISYSPDQDQIGPPQQEGQFDINNDGGRDFANDVAIGSDDSVYVVGSYETSNTGLDTYVAKFNPNNLSTPTWVRSIGTEARDEGQSITVARENGSDVIYISGFTDGDIDGDLSSGDTETTDFWLAKLDATNETDPVINEREVIGGNEKAQGIVSSGGDIYVTGTTTGFVDSQNDSENDPTSNFGRTDAWLSKYDGETFTSASQANWTEQFGSAANDLAQDLTVSSFRDNNGTPDDPSDDFFGRTKISITGHTEGQLNGQVNQGSLDAWVVEFIDDRAEDSISSPNKSPAFTESPIFEQNGFILDPITTTAAEGTTVGIVGVSDPQNDDITLAITEGDGNQALAIANDGTITVNDPADVTNSFSLTVRAIDDEGNNSSTTAIIPVNRNESPAVGDSTFFAEVANGSVGTVNATDPDNDVLTFSITGGSNQGAFDINEETGAIRVVNSVGINPGDSLTLEVTGNDGTAIDTGEVTVNFAGVPPQFPQEKGYTQILDPNNAANDQTVGIVEAVDLEGKTVTYSIVAGDPNNAFSLNENSGELTVNNVNQLSENFDLTIEANDENQTTQTHLIVGLTNDDVPELSNSTFEVDEFATGTNVGTVNFVNPDPDGNDTLTFSITNGDPNGIFTINDQGDLEVDSSAVSPGDSFTLTVEANDGTDTDTGDITVDFAGEAPEFSQEQGFKFDINDTNISNNDLVGTVQATDPEEQSVTYSLINGDPNNAFNLNANTGELTVNDNTQLNESFDLTVEADDGSQTQTTQVIVEWPEDDIPELSNSTFEVDEFATVTNVGTLNFANPDPNANDNLGFVILDDDGANGIFSINDNQGGLTVDSSAVSPGESFTLTVQVGDGTDTDTGDITVNFAGESPKFVDEPPQFNPKEGFTFDVIDPANPNIADGDVVGTVQASDPEAEQITFDIAGGNPGNFNLDSTSGEVTVNNPGQLTQNVELTITADDGNGNVARTSALIPVNAQNDPPVVADTNLVVEDVAEGTVLGSINVADPDRDPLTFAPETFDPDGDGIDNFAINDEGVVILQDNTGISLGDEFSFDVDVTDDGGETATSTVSVDFRDLVELDPETGTKLIGTPESDFSRDIASDRGGNIFLAGQTSGVLNSAEPPQLIDVTVTDSETVNLTYDKQLDSVNLPSLNQFTVEVDQFVDGSLAIDDQVIPNDEVVVNNRTVELTLAQQALQPSSLVQVIYQDKSPLENDTNAIQDNFGNDALSFNFFAENNIGAPNEDTDQGEGAFEEQQNAGRTDIWVSRLGGVNPSPNQNQTETDQLSEPTQQVTAEVNDPIIFQQQQFSVDVNYEALNVDGDPISGGLSGLGLRMHFNSDQLSFEGLSEVNENNLNFQGQPELDANNADGDATTDQVVNISWLATEANWPENTSGEADLFNANFTTALEIGENEADINFTSSSSAEGFVFSSSDVTVSPEKYTYDIDGNGQLDALTDGLQIISHLFEPNDVLESAIASNAGRDFDEDGAVGEPEDDIQAYLNFSGNTNPFDVDGNGEADPLTDGVMIARFMFGFRGDALTSGVLDTDDATRDLVGGNPGPDGVVNAADIEAYIQNFI